MDFKNLEKDLLIFLDENLKVTGRKNFILGVSGGLDSAVVSVLCKKVAPTYAKIMPTNSSNQVNLDDAINHCKAFDINYEICPIDKLIKTYEKIFLNKKISTHRIGNLSARIRMMVLYDLSEELDAVVVGTSNLSELMLGYGTIFGDYNTTSKEIYHGHTPSVINQIHKRPNNVYSMDVGANFCKNLKILEIKSKTEFEVEI